MGLFSFKNLKDTISGKNYKINILITSNYIKIIQKVISKKDFVSRWSLQGAASISAYLEFRLFENYIIKDEIGQKVNVNNFKMNLKLLTPEKTFKIFKLLCSHYLISFLKNERNVSFLKDKNLNAVNFEKNIFQIFEFTSYDEHFYRKLDKCLIDGDGSNYFLKLYVEIFRKGFMCSYQKDAADIFIFSNEITNRYKEFLVKIK